MYGRCRVFVRMRHGGRADGGGSGTAYWGFRDAGVYIESVEFGDIEDEIDGFSYWPASSLVNAYIEKARPSLISGARYESGELFFGLVFESEAYCQSAERLEFYGDTIGVEQQKARFLELARRNGDTGFHGELPAWMRWGRWYQEYFWRPEQDMLMADCLCCLAEPVRAVHARAVTDWDEAHPAGSSLDGVFSLYSLDIAGVIAAGYRPSDGSTLDKYSLHHFGISTLPDWGKWRKLDELTRDELRILSAFVLLRVESPSIERCCGRRFRIEVEMDDGTVYCMDAVLEH